MPEIVVVGGGITGTAAAWLNPLIGHRRRSDL